LPNSSPQGDLKKVTN